MIECEAFLAEIAAHPDDDAPRLIYADWLEEHGEPERAELIRVQCRVATMREPSHRHEPGRCVSYAPILCAYHALKKREKELLFAQRVGVPPNWCRWLGTNGPIVDAIYKRGFLGIIHLPSAVWLRDGPAIVREHPVLQEVRLTDREPFRSTTFTGAVPRVFVWEENRPHDTRHYPYLLPPALFRFMQPYEVATLADGTRLELFADEPAAWAALSNAALEYARRQSTRTVAPQPESNQSIQQAR